MELDEFKTAIREENVNVWAEQVGVDGEINIRKHTASLIGEIKKSLILEMASGVLFILFITWLVYKSPAFYVAVFGLLMMGLCFCFIYYLAALYRRITRYQATTCTIKRNLEQIITILQQFTRLYFVLTLIMIPLILVGAFFLIYAGGGAIVKSSVTIYSSQRIITYFVLSAAWYAAMYFFTRWYIRKLYGNHLTALKIQLKDLEYE